MKNLWTLFDVIISGKQGKAKETEEEGAKTEWGDAGEVTITGEK